MKLITKNKEKSEVIYKGLTHNELLYYQQKKLKRDFHFFRSIMPSVKIFIYVFTVCGLAFMFLKKSPYFEEKWRKFYFLILDVEDKNIDGE